MRLPALRGKSQQQVKLGYIARKKCLEAWENVAERANVKDADYERLVSNVDATWWIANQKRTLEEVLARMQNNLSLTADNKNTPVKPHHKSLSNEQLKYAASLKKALLRYWQKEPLWHRLAEEQRQWLLTRPPLFWIEYKDKRSLLDILEAFPERMQELARTTPSQMEEKKPGGNSFTTTGPLRDSQTGEIVPDNEECPF